MWRVSQTAIKRIHVRQGASFNYLNAVQFLRAIAECFARLSHGLGVCPSVCPSVSHTLALYQNGEDKIIKSLKWAVSRSLVFRDKISCPWVEGSTRTTASKKGTPSKRRYFDPIGSSNVKTVADRYTHVAYYNQYTKHQFIHLSTATCNEWHIPMDGFARNFAQGVVSRI